MQKFKTFGENLPKLKKEQARIIFVTSLVLALMFVFFIASSRSFKSDEGTTFSEGNNSSTIYLVEGGPRLERIELNSRTLQDGENITEEDIITNDGISRSVIVFADNSFLIADNNTAFKILEIQQNSDSFTQIEVTLGKVFFRPVNGFEYETKFKVITPSAIVTSVNSRVDLSVDESGNTTVNSVVGETKLTAKKNEETKDEVTIEEGKSLKVESSKFDNNSTENLAKLLVDIAEEKGFWSNFFKCIDSKVSELLQDEANRRGDYVKTQIGSLKDCYETAKNKEFEEQEEEARKEAEKIIKKQEDDISKTAPELNSVIASISGEDRISCNWAASGEGIKGFEYSIGTSAGGTQKLPWTNTSETAVVVQNLNLDYAETYFCNVKVKGEFGDSEVKSSAGVIYDNSTATIDIGSSNLPGTINGSVDYDNIPNDNDLVVEFYIKNAEGKFRDQNGNWGTSQYLYQAAKSGGGGSSFNWQFGPINGSASEFDGGTIYAQVRNKETGRTLDQTTVNIP